MRPLPNDYQRCYGQNCDIKTKCRRFLTIDIDALGLYLYTATMREIDDEIECVELIRMENKK